MGGFKDLTGQKFGRLTVLYRGENLIRNNGRARVQWMCECDCEKHTKLLVLSSSLTSGHTKSCGCLVSESSKNRMTKHGDSNSKLYRVWVQMLDRCENIGNKRYDDYGGRGISVCQEWRDYITFKTWAMNNGYKEGLSIDRINNDKGYNPLNCRWTTKTTQSNNMRSNHIINFNGKAQTIAQWARELDIDYNYLYDKLYKHNFDLNIALRVINGGKKYDVQDP